MQGSDRHSIARAIERWFARHQRPLPWRERYDPFHVWVSEVMLQQTRMEVVLPYFERFVERFPTLDALAAATEDEVMAAWSGLGYYRRARMLREGAIAVVERFEGRVPKSVDDLLALPGIGRYTAGAIASVAWNRRAPIVDGNVARILSRLFAIDAPLASPALMREAWAREEELVAACTKPRDFNQGLMEVGALICTPRNPSCLACPVRAHCATRGDHLPRAKEKKATRAMRIPLYLITDRRGRVLMRRESGPLMNAMLHLPHGDTSLLTGRPLAVTAKALLGTFRHTVTTRRIEFALYAANARNPKRREYVWIDPEAMSEVPHPSYVAKALRLWCGREET
ncbi:MAG TPA: A/G-specific adenine glycosylase [Thermoanaerobaculia bacterium]|nr:A/G-specific adenine glycosylase [Thermoanaerobaculia bacterium]